MTQLTAAPPRRRLPTQAQLALAGVSAVVLGAGMLAVRNGTVGALERDAFEAVNGLPDALAPVLWPILQLGAIAIVPLIAGAALLARRPRLAVAVLAVGVLKLVAERLVKAAVSRERPGTSIGPDINRRSGVPMSGERFVSGHAMLAAALAVVVTPYLSGRWKVLPAVLAAAVAVGRVYVGAHNPLDVLCGAACGVVIGIAVDLLTRRREDVRAMGEGAVT
jgi:membrane-associated phospholipid phosphatase